MGIRRQKKMIFQGRPAAPLTIIRHAKIMWSTLKLLSLSLRKAREVPPPPEFTGSQQLDLAFSLSSCMPLGSKIGGVRRREGGSPCPSATGGGMRRRDGGGPRHSAVVGEVRRRAATGRRQSAPLGVGRRRAVAGRRWPASDLEVRRHRRPTDPSLPLPPTL